jgi:hypothetical protein
MPKPYYLGLVTNHGNVEATGFDLQSQYAAWSHADLYPHETRDLRKHWRVDRTLIHFDQEPTLEDFFRTMDWAERERVKLTKIKLGWHGREMPLSTFDPRQLRERHMPKVSRKSLILQEVKLPLAEIGLIGPTRMEVQRRYNVHRATGSSIQGAIRKVEMELGISDVQVNASGKDVVFFKNPDDSYTIGEAVEVNEVWKSMTSVSDWTGANPGYDFRIIAHTPTGRQIIDRTPNLKTARQIAKNYYRQSKRRVEVLDAKERRYFSLGN